jgi:cell division GTPase FtsZ
VLLAGVRSVTDLMVMPGLINLDFSDVQAVMADMGNAMMGKQHFFNISIHQHFCELTVNAVQRSSTLVLAAVALCAASGSSHC